ncbi:MAG: hypothetical protein KDC98_20305, partial [Planctomycetes bacterium]|nr:hypothetical protein [Planctomycetota bacterium]
IDAQQRRSEEGRSALPNPDQFVDRWLERSGDAVIRRLVELGLLPQSALEQEEVGNFAARRKASPLPVEALKARLSADFNRSRALYKEWERAEERRQEQRRLRLEARLAAYEAQAAGRYVEGLADDPRLHELAIARYLEARRRNAPTVGADFFVIRGKDADAKDAKVEIHVVTRVTADPALYVGPYQSVLHRLDRAAAAKAAESGRIDDIELLPPVLEALRAEVRRLGPAPQQPADEAPVIIPFVAVYAQSMPDLSGALAGTWEHLPGVGAPTAHGHLMGQVIGAVVGAGEPEPAAVAAAPIASSAATQVRMAVRPADQPRGLRGRGGPPNWEAPTAENAHAMSSRDSTPHVWTTWADRPEQARCSYRVRVHGGIPAFDKTFDGRLGIARGKEIAGTGIHADRVVIAFEVPANTAGRILVEGEVIAQPPRGNGEPLATHAFHTGVDYAPAPLSGSGSASRSGNGRVAIGVRVEGAQRGNRIATVEAGGQTRFVMFGGSSLSLTLPNGSPLPGSVTVSFRNYGRDAALAVDLEQKDAAQRPIDERAIARYEADIDKWSRSKNGAAEYLPAIHKAYSMLAQYCYEGDPARAVRYARLALDFAEQALEAAANPQWVGFRHPDLRHDGMNLESWLRRGDEQGKAAHLAIRQRLRSDVIYALLRAARSLVDVGDFDTAALLASRAGELYGPLKANEKLAGNLVTTFEDVHAALSRAAFARTGDFDRAQAEIDRANVYRRYGAELGGREFRPRMPSDRPDPDFDAGDGR